MRTFVSEVRDCHYATLKLLKKAKLSADVPIPVLKFFISFLDQVMQDLESGDPQAVRSAMAWIHSREQHFMSPASVAEVIGTSRGAIADAVSYITMESERRAAA